MPLTDFFLASMQELRAACPGWKAPLPRPVKRQGVNPFTKKPIEILTTAPDPAEFDAGASKHADSARLHRVDLKGLSPVELEGLVRVVLEESDSQVSNVYDVPLYAPPGTDEVIFRVPPALVDRLARLDAAALASCVEQWNTASGRNLSEYLAPLAELARKAVVESREMFMWMCP